MDQRIISDSCSYFAPIVGSGMTETSLSCPLPFPTSGWWRTLACCSRVLQPSAPLGAGGESMGESSPGTEEIWKQTWTGLGLLTVISFLCALGGFALTELFTESWQEPCNAVCLQALWCIEKRRSSRGAACKWHENHAASSQADDVFSDLRTCRNFAVWLGPFLYSKALFSSCSGFGGFLLPCCFMTLSVVNVDWLTKIIADIAGSSCCDDCSKIRIFRCNTNATTCSMLMRPKTLSIFDCVHSRKLQAFWLALLLEDIWVAVSSTSLGSSSMSLRSLSSVLLCSVEFKMICGEIHHHPIKLFRGLEHGQEHDSGWNLYDPEQEVLWTPGWGSKRIVNWGLFRICILKSSGFPNLGKLHVCTNLFANSPTLPRYNHVSQHTSPGFKCC